ncbi:MAG: aminotransferase class I/II-fold pyridoxal phosphate-dependent enzyme [Zavarzinella sp.]
MHDHWIAERMSRIETSGIRRVFDLGKKLTNPINLSIGQPHFPVPDVVQQAAISAIQHGGNGYSVTQGVASLLQKLKLQTQTRLPGQKRELLVTSGTSGALVLAMISSVNPGDEVIIFDPYFVAYPNLIAIAGGVPVIIDTYPDFQIDVEKVRAAITPRTKMIIFSSPANPTGITTPRETLQALVELAKEHQILLVSDEIYRAFWYDGPFCSASEFDENVLVVDGFGKTYAVTGWRLGFAHGPAKLIDKMATAQQFTFVCAPQPFQLAAEAMLDYDVTSIVDDYRKKRVRICDELADCYKFNRSQGAFYLFAEAPGGDANRFFEAALEKNLLIIPGGAFSKRNTHFRVSFAADDETLSRGIAVLKELAAG